MPDAFQRNGTKASRLKPLPTMKQSLVSRMGANITQSEFVGEAFMHLSPLGGDAFPYDAKERSRISARRASIA